MSMRRWWRVGAALPVLMFALPAAQAQRITVDTKVHASTVVQTVTAGGVKGEIDWTKMVLRVQGMGVPKQGITHPGQKKLTAREAALATAYRDLAAAVQGIHVTSEISVEDAALVSSRIDIQLKAFVKGAVIVADSEKWDRDDEIYTVVLAVPLTGPDGLARILRDNNDVVEKVAKEKDASAPKARIPAKPIPAPTPLPTPKEAPTTGLIIDCRGLGLKPAMAPKVVRPDGSEVWGTVKVATDFVLEHGIVGYVSSLDAAQASPRAGDNPLVIRAIGKQGSYSANAVVSEEDAQKLLDAAKRANPNFLKGFRVTFVLDPKPHK